MNDAIVVVAVQLLHLLPLTSGLESPVEEFPSSVGSVWFSGSSISSPSLSVSSGSEFSVGCMNVPSFASLCRTKSVI